MTGIAERIAAAESVLDGLSGRDLSDRAARISRGYRDNLPSRQTIRDDTDAAIYALMRMPATAAAVDAALDAFVTRAPGFEPASVLDAGAGPGTASLCAGAYWPEAAHVLCDDHAAMLTLARQLFADVPGGRRYVQADFTNIGQPLPGADLVIAAYALTEIGDAAYARAAESLWHAAAGALVVVEPGRPRDYTRLMEFRSWAIGQGAHVAAPCPHHGECPLAGPDWCHFGVRLGRSRAHRRLKAGALGYEDEKFSYLVLTRPDVALEPPAPRVLAPPETNKHEMRFKLCETDGQESRRGIARRNPQFGQIRRVKWGDVLPAADGPAGGGV